MPAPVTAQQSLWELILSGGFTIYPLVICSLVVWVVIFERIWNYRRLGHHLRAFHLEAMNALLRKDIPSIYSLCQRHADLPTARLVLAALEKLSSSDAKLKMRWLDSLERSRQLINLELRQNFWLLGTIGSCAPFIGLFGTVVGVLRSFQEMGRTGVGGFSTVAAGISESLVATAAGIVVAVVAVMAYNAFQTRWSSLVLVIRLNLEELCEILEVLVAESPSVFGASSLSGKEGP